MISIGKVDHVIYKCDIPSIMRPGNSHFSVGTSSKGPIAPVVSPGPSTTFDDRLSREIQYLPLYNALSFRYVIVNVQQQTFLN